MRVKLSNSTGLERKLAIELPAAEVDASVDERLREAARNMKLNGFRKGKVPFGLVRKRFGKDIRREVVSGLMSESLLAAIRQEGLRPAGRPQLELIEVAEGEDLRFEAVFEVMPEIELPDFSRIRIESLTAEVADEDVDNMIEILRAQQRVWEPADRAAADGDLVNIDFAGRADGKEFEGGKAEGRNVLIGSQHMIPGFEEALKGRRSGEEFSCELRFPDEYQPEEYQPDQYRQEHLAGKDVVFDIRINSVKGPRLPEVDEEFYRNFGVEEGGEDAFRKEIIRNMERELKLAQRNRLKGKIIEAVMKRANVDAPETMVGEEMARLRAEAAEIAGGAPELPDELLRDRARRRVVMSLIIGEIIEANEIKADAARVREAVEELASTYESPEEVVRWYYGDEERLSTVEESVLEDQVFDYISGQAKLTEKTVSYQAAIRG